MVEQAYRITATAHLFQEFVEKQCDIRAIVIGDEIFATEIHGLSEETYIDFRSDYSKLRYIRHHLPDTIRDALLALNRAYRLVYSAIDLVYTPDGEYIFLELNAAGQFGWLEGRTGVPLYRTLAQLLTSSATRKGDKRDNRVV